MTEFIMNVPCDYCNGDGYLQVTNQQWADYILWVQDPTENKSNSQDNFPQFLKMLTSHVGISFEKNKVVMPCVKCRGEKTIQKTVTLQELIGLLR